MAALLDTRTGRLIEYLLPEPWQRQCEIIPNHLPKFPSGACPMCAAGTPPARVVYGGRVGDSAVVHVAAGAAFEDAKPCRGPATQPRLVVRYGPPYDAEGGQWYLRYSIGPAQGHFWDVYGEDYQNDDLAILAISMAPAPPRGTPYVTFTIPLRGAQLDTKARR